MNFLELETFIAIVRLKSISKAAESLYISQSAAGQRLISLEKEIGYDLIERRKGYKTIELTSKGKLFLPLAEKELALYQEMVSLQSTRIRLPLNIGAMASINYPIFTEFFNTLANGVNIKEFELNISTNRSNELYELIDKRDIDVAIVSEEYNYDDIHVCELFQEKIYLAKLKSVNGNKQISIHPSELKKEDEIQISWSEKIDIWKRQYWPPAIPSYIQIDIPSALPMFFSNEKNWALIPSSMIMYLEQFDKLDFINIDPLPPKRVCFLLTHRYPISSKKESIMFFKKSLFEYVKAIDIQTKKYIFDLCV